jgi:hypothetical protein
MTKQLAKHRSKKYSRHRTTNQRWHIADWYTWVKLPTTVLASGGFISIFAKLVFEGFVTRKSAK